MTRRLTIKLPEPDAVIDAEDAGGDTGLVDSWELAVLGPAPALSITAWGEGVDIDGDLYEADRLYLLEHDARAVLAAIAAHRRYDTNATSDTPETGA